MLIGVDVGGTNLRVGVVDALQLVEQTRVHADFSGLCRTLPAAEALARIHAILTESLAPLLAAYPACRAVGIGFPGFVDPASGRVSQSPNLPGLRDIDLAGPLRQRLGVPVVVENDALAAAYGEYRLHGLTRGLIYLGLGTGVGGGLILAGAPYPGEHGVAMEVGHLIVEPHGRPCGCGNRGCLEQYASASGVATSFRAATGRASGADEIAALAAAGDSAALAAYADAGSRLAQALAHMLKVVDIGDIVIGGGMSEAWPLLAPTFHARLEADLIPALRGRLRVALSRCGDQAGMLGAALLAARRLAAAAP